jgi:hypothetical protein
MRKIINGSVVTQFRFTNEQIAGILMDHLIANGEDVPQPDFGDGEGDQVRVEIRDAASNTIFGAVTDGKELALVISDNEDDPVAAAE